MAENGVCSECADRLKLKVIGMTGSWGPVMCEICRRRQADVIVEQIVDIVDRAAKAILAAGFEVPAHDIVVVALKAMREPTPLMIKAADEALLQNDAEEEHTVVWRAMIDAARKSPEVR